MIPTIDQARRFGFHFPDGARWISEGARAAADAAPYQTLLSTTVPAELTQYIEQDVVRILTAPTNARALLPEVKKGDWSASHAKFRIQEFSGRTAPYSDTAAGGTSDVNAEWMSREQYRFQTLITYGELEMAVLGAAKVDLVSEKQKAAASVLDINANKYYLYGVEGKGIHGFLNDPDLPAALAVSAGSTSGNIGWKGKSTTEIYEDIVSVLYMQLVAQTKGLITSTSALTLALSPSMHVYLSKATDFNVSVMDMLGKYFTSLTIVSLPELKAPAGAETAVMFVRELNGIPTGHLAYSDKMRTHPLITKGSSYEQKISSTTFGCVIYYPLAFASITGMESAS